MINKKQRNYIIYRNHRIRVDCSNKSITEYFSQILIGFQPPPLYSGLYNHSPQSMIAPGGGRRGGVGVGVEGGSVAWGAW